MNNLEAKIFAAQLDQNIPTIDLHGQYPSLASTEVDVFLFRHFVEGDDTVVKIVYGGGTGKLGQTVRDILAKHSLVKQVVVEHGCCLVVI